MSTDTLSRRDAQIAAWLAGKEPIVTAVARPAGDPARAGVGWHRLGRDAALAVPILLVNGFAVYGQAVWAVGHLPGGWPVAWLFAAALESVGIYLAVEAHAALMAGDAALGRRLASYAVAGLVGFLNWLHWAGPGGQPTVRAAVFAGFSAVSPWLWAIRSRSLRRSQLRAAGLIDPRTVRFAAARWLLYPVRTFRAFRLAVWEAEQDPARAIALLATAATPSPTGATLGLAAETPRPLPVRQPLIAVPGPEVPPVPKAPARPATRTPVARRTATDAEVTAVIRGLPPGAGRVTVARALNDAGLSRAKDALDRLIAAARERS
jgi:hypothetical protein